MIHISVYQRLTKSLEIWLANMRSGIIGARNDLEAITSAAHVINQVAFVYATSAMSNAS